MFYPFSYLWRYAVAWTDVCIINDNEFLLLLLQEVKKLTSMIDQEPQVIAKAIAPFALNNRKREYGLDLFPCNSVMFPCFTMVGTMPVFYKIAITAKPFGPALIPRPKNVSFVTFPPFLSGTIRECAPLPNRFEILRCLEAFKNFLIN